MSTKFQIVAVEKPEWSLIGGGLHNFNIEQAGPDNGQTLCFVVQNLAGEKIGGVIGHLHWDWFNGDSSRIS
jgi:hypothetical protein